MSFDLHTVLEYLTLGTFFFSRYPRWPWPVISQDRGVIFRAIKGSKFLKAFRDGRFFHGPRRG